MTEQHHAARVRDAENIDADTVGDNRSLVVVHRELNDRFSFLLLLHQHRNGDLLAGSGFGHGVLLWWLTVSDRIVFANGSIELVYAPIRTRSHRQELLHKGMRGCGPVAAETPLASAWECLFDRSHRQALDGEALPHERQQQRGPRGED